MDNNEVDKLLNTNGDLSLNNAVSHGGGDANIGTDVLYSNMQKSIDESEAQALDELYKSENKRKGGLLFYVGLTYFIVMLLLIGVRVLSNLGVFDSLNIIVTEFVTSGLIQVLIMFAIPVFAFCFAKKQKFKETLKDFQFKKISGSIVLIAIILGIIIFCLNGFISSIFASLISLFGYETLPSSSTTGSDGASIWYFLTTVICSCLLPAICEETAHRGLLLNGIKRYGVGKAVLISGLLFGLIHLNINQFFYATIVGWFLGFLTVISGSIYPAMIIHFINNFLNCLSEYAYLNNFDFFSLNAIINFMDSTIGTLFTNFLIFLFILALIYLLSVLVYKIYCKQKYPDFVNKIIKKNYVYFFNRDYFSSSKSKQDEILKDFLGTDKLQAGTMAYVLSKSNSSNSFWDNFEQVYPKKYRKEILPWAFIVGAIVMGFVATIFTFVWGIL
ncbi:MAG: CPBP family intramembrane metalloprotease [Clostridia bacterium]|nr:CPBP family intramembrane metalloprotease [Clostridia bacterium]